MILKSFLMFLLVTNMIHSQYKIEYDYTMGDSNSSIVLKSFLYTDGINSKFVKNRVFADKDESEMLNVSSALLEKMKSFNKTQDGDSIGHVVLKKMNNDTVVSRLLKSKNEYVKVTEINNPIIEIKNGIKNILNYKCQNATFIIDKRVFEVWFTTEIPITDGPWKIKGLPGMVLAAKTDDGYHTYQAKSVLKTNEFANTFFTFPDAQTMTKKKYIEDFLVNFEKRFKYNKSRTKLDNFKMTMNNLDLPLTVFE